MAFKKWLLLYFFEVYLLKNMRLNLISGYPTKNSADYKYHPDDVTYTNIPITKIIQHGQQTSEYKNSNAEYNASQDNLINGHDNDQMTKSENFNSDLKHYQRDTRARTR